MQFIWSVQSEWLKKKRSLAVWLVVVGGFFTPTIVIIARLVYPNHAAVLYAKHGFWRSLWQNSWESMAIFLLPMGCILIVSLITQLEYKNNAWKQVYTLPISLTTIFCAKLAVIFLMVGQFFVFFNIGIYLSAVIPCLLLRDVPYPQDPIPFLAFLAEDLYYFIDCLPIIALQYLLSLQYKNFLLPIGIGFMFWVGSLAVLSWQYGYTIPYTYCMLQFLKSSGSGKAVIPTSNLQNLASSYFVGLISIAYLMFLTKKEKG